MKKVFIVVFFILFYSFAFAAPVKTVSGTVVKVADGDTITILDGKNSKIKVRLYGIDAPEIKQAFGKEAQVFLAEIAGGKEVDVAIYNIDRYGRSVGIVYLGGADVNRQMVAEGYAWVYPRYHKLPSRDEWLSLQTVAQGNKLGLWQAESITPWDWRKAN